MEKMSQAEFCETDGLQCPKCRGRTVTLEVDDSQAGKWLADCSFCGTEYDVVLKITGYEITFEGSFEE